MTRMNRREFVGAAAGATAMCAASVRAFAQTHSTFQLSVLTDEIS